LTALNRNTDIRARVIVTCLIWVLWLGEKHVAFYLSTNSLEDFPRWMKSATWAWPVPRPSSPLIRGP